MAQTDRTAIRHILLVEDNPDHAALAMHALRRHFGGASIGLAATAEEAERLFSSEDWDAVVVDYSLPRANGLDLLAKMSQARPHVPLVMLTGHGDEQVAVAAMKQGAADYVTKSGGYLALLPSSVESAIRHMRLVCDRERLAREVAHRNRHLSAVNAVAVAVSRSLRLEEMLAEVLAEVCAVTRLPAAVFLPGDERGVLRLAAHRGLSPEGAREIASQPVTADAPAAGAPDGAAAGPSFFALAADGELPGLLAVFPQADSPLDAGDAEMLATLARVVGMGVRNALLFEETRALSLQDELTALGNRRLFNIKLHGDFETAKRYGTRLALVLLDIDHFKRVNDAHGHPTGDAVLKRLGAILLARSRSSDLTFRYGGEEFAMLLPHTGQDAAVRVAERIRLAVATEAFPAPSGSVVHITLSAGVACYGDPMDKEQELIDLADRALYGAKQAGRDRVCALDG